MQSIYLDNAATSFPKPAGVSDSMKQYLDCVGATINRSVYGRAQEAGLETLALREVLARLFRFPEPATHVVLTPGATFGLNLVIKGLLRPGDHCIVSGMEHNAVMRPLQQLGGVEFDRIPCDSEGFLQHGALEGLFRPNTRLVVLAHASNVCGSVQDAAAVGAACARHGCFFLLDGGVLDGFLQTLDFAVQLFQPVIQKRSILIKVQGHFQQAVKFLLGLLQLLLQIWLCAFAGLDVMQDAVDLGSDFIGEVCSQILHGFQNCTVQFLFRDGR